jgi:hypothetical protein
LLKHLGRERAHLFTFLRHPELDVPATNWRAKQGIRPAVMIRKTWGGNATWKGARMQECLMSACRTGRLQGAKVIGALTELQRQPHLGLLPGLLFPRLGWIEADEHPSSPPATQRQRVACISAASWSLGRWQRRPGPRP